MLIPFFSRKSKGQQPPDMAPERRALPYDPGLIPSLTHQHRSLVMLLVKAHSAAQQQQYADVQFTLEQFRRDLEAHLLRESMDLHPYLDTHLTGVDAKSILREMRANSVYIERAVDGFLNHYRSYPVTERTAMRFGIEISGVSEEFCERIEKEEATVYTLYMPPEAY